MRFVWVYLIIILSAGAAAVGIAPANHEIDLDVDQELDYRIYNTEGKSMVVNIAVNGSLAPFVTFVPTELTFAKDERVKSVKLKVSEPEYSGTYSATITAGDVEARLDATIFKPPPTGMVVSETDGPKYLYPILLLLVVIVNVVFLVTKKAALGPAEKILRKLKKMDSNEFNKYVTKDENVFADQLHMKIPELAFRIYEITNRRQMIASIEEYLARTKKKKTPQELKKEIKELKHELDTFDFSEFEAEK